MKVKKTVYLENKEIEALKTAAYVLSNISTRMWSVDDIKAVAFGNFEGSNLDAEVVVNWNPLKGRC